MNEEIHRHWTNYHSIHIKQLYWKNDDSIITRQILQSSYHVPELKKIDVRLERIALLGICEIVEDEKSY